MEEQIISLMRALWEAGFDVGWVAREKGNSLEVDHEPSKRAKEALLAAIRQHKVDQKDGPDFPGNGV